ncbi:MAG TPA: aminopeptidase N [Jatrophihabitans sp.]|jgi:aminopeptidase N|uniref:aminopeptidase N n=1 Tax=Jatrophihabitans sp. TaxID=1932789 RepID=UPI002EEAE28F
MPSLTRREAAERAALLTVRNYRIALDVDGAGADFGSDTVIEFAAHPGASTFLDLQASAVLSVLLNDEPVDPAGLVDGRLPLTGLRAANVLRIRARMAYSTDGEGIHRHVDPADGRTYLYAMSFLDAAPRWFGCFDQPDLKASFDIEVRCPPEWNVIGNGAATRTAPGRWQLASTQPLATYFVTLVAGPYASITAEHDGIVLGVHARASLAEHLKAEATDILSVTTASLDRYHELFGIRYPFGEYHQAFVPDFNAGAMENPGCVTLRDQFIFRSAATRGERSVRASTIAHEMAHMWFGDLVTMRWWDDLWLNESFAEYMGYRVCAEMTGELAELAWIESALHRKDWGRIADQAPSNHPVAGNGSESAAAALADFDGISYAKGASVLKQLAAHLGDEVFFAGLRRHFDQHRFGNAEFADLIGAWVGAGAADLPGWAEVWLRTSGLDTLTAEQRDTGEVWLGRTAAAGARRPHTIRVTGFDAEARPRLEEQVTLHDDAVRVSQNGAGPLRLVVADSADDSWAKIRFGTAGWQPVAELLPRIAAAPTRVVLYNAIRDAVRDADLDPAQALDTVLAAVAVEPVELVTAELLEFATKELAGNYARPADRAGRRSRVAGLAHRLLAGAEPGSDQQLEAARAGIRATDDVAWLRAWWAGEQLPDGLAIDAELRWALVTRLAALGALSEAGIDAELARDESTSGVVHAARARAVRPDPAAKQAAWALLTQPSQRPAYELYAIAESFFEPSQSELTAGYLPRFFAEMPATAGHRHGWALGSVIFRAFPVSAASPDVLRLAEDALAEPRAAELAPPVRRALVDGTDALRRALRSLQRHGGV